MNWIVALLTLAIRDTAFFAKDPASKHGASCGLRLKMAQVGLDPIDLLYVIYSITPLKLCQPGSQLFNLIGHFVNLAIPQQLTTYTDWLPLTYPITFQSLLTLFGYTPSSSRAPDSHPP